MQKSATKHHNTWVKQRFTVEIGGRWNITNLLCSCHSKPRLLLQNPWDPTKNYRWRLVLLHLLWFPCRTELAVWEWNQVALMRVKRWQCHSTIFTLIYDQRTRIYSKNNFTSVCSTLHVESIWIWHKLFWFSLLGSVVHLADIGLGNVIVALAFVFIMTIY